jgi:probable phosphoglycerate mutase
VRFPAGESFLEVQSRAVAELGRIAGAHPSGTVAVVTHADVLRLLIAHHAGMHPDHLQRLVVDPGSVTVVTVSEGSTRLLKVNDTGGLESLRPRRRSRARR